MALRKKIVSFNGLETNYHRINSVQKIINDEEVIEVYSYYDESKRNIELTKDANGIMTTLDILKFEKEYNETETIQDCYNYLKTLDDFKDTEDV